MKTPDPHHQRAPAKKRAVFPTSEAFQVAIDSALRSSVAFSRLAARHHAPGRMETTVKPSNDGSDPVSEALWDHLSESKKLHACFVETLSRAFPFQKKVSPISGIEIDPRTVSSLAGKLRYLRSCMNQSVHAGLFPQVLTNPHRVDSNSMWIGYKYEVQFIGLMELAEEDLYPGFSQNLEKMCLEKGNASIHKVFGKRPYIREAPEKVNFVDCLGNPFKFRHYPNLPWVQNIVRTHEDFDKYLKMSHQVQMWEDDPKRKTARGAELRYLPNLEDVVLSPYNEDGLRIHIRIIQLFGWLSHRGNNLGWANLLSLKFVCGQLLRDYTPNFPTLPKSFEEGRQYLAGYLSLWGKNYKDIQELDKELKKHEKDTLEKISCSLFFPRKTSGESEIGGSPSEEFTDISGSIELIAFCALAQNELADPLQKLTDPELAQAILEMYPQITESIPALMEGEGDISIPSALYFIQRYRSRYNLEIKRLLKSAEFPMKSSMYRSLLSYRYLRQKNKEDLVAVDSQLRVVRRYLNEAFLPQTKKKTIRSFSGEELTLKDHRGKGYEYKLVGQATLQWAEKMYPNGGIVENFDETKTGLFVLRSENENN